MAEGSEITLELFSSLKSASAVEFRITTPDQTPEEAEAAIRAHARDLLGIKALLDTESWREAQLALRDVLFSLNTVCSVIGMRKTVNTSDKFIVFVAGIPQPPQEKLAHEFQYVLSEILDYAARDKDKKRVHECYNNIAATLDEIFERI
ncbi:psbQ-like protein 3, chloroplastic [Ananas comosus]|uniref:PsbQ-like protein 3, chloroplastic n=1 Tax=Ananas comosus TaxID=4615 RepID=A0A6P5FHN6_ANACO|nr:psbQ-like protein 3, chloroplastic [Ananas comosus]